MFFRGLRKRIRLAVSAAVALTSLALAAGCLKADSHGDQDMGFGVSGADMAVLEATPVLSATPVVATEGESAADDPGTVTSFDLSQIPAYSGVPVVEVNGNVPFFADEELTTEAFEEYGDMDSLGRCTAAYACLGPETLPTEERGEIGMIKPSGWHTVKYPEQIEDLYLFNRCHLIAHELSAENANEKNLITGTRYMNVSGMLPYENETTWYIKDSGNHVMYRSTPVFAGDELVARGVLLEAKSVEDDGISFCVFCYNVQPGIEIDYSTGESWVV